MRKTVFILTSLFIVITMFYPISAVCQEERGDILFSKGVLLFEEKNYGEALKMFQDAEKQTPDDSALLFYIGLTHTALGETKKAIPYFEKVIVQSPDNIDAKYYLGQAYISEKEYSKALAQLETVYKEMPEREDITFFIGLAYYESKNYQKALENFLKTVPSSNEVKELNLYYTGLAQQQLGKTEEAGKTFNLVLNTAAPQSPILGPTQKFLESMELIKKDARRYRFTASASLLYDSNVNALPIHNKDDKHASFGELVYVKADYAIVKSNGYETRLGYSFFETVYNRMEKFNIQDHQIDLSTLVKFKLWEKPSYWNTTLAWDHLLLGNTEQRSFMHRTTLRNSLTYVKDNANLTVFTNHFQYKNYYKFYSGTGVDTRDALNFLIGAIHFFRFASDKHLIKVGYLFDRDFAEGNDWDYYGHKFVFGGQYTFPHQIKFNADAVFHLRKYSHVDSGGNEKRQDIEQVYAVSLSRDIINNLKASLDYSITKNFSNISVFNYVKQVTSIGLSWNY